MSKEGLDRLHELGRLDLSGEHQRLAWKHYEDEIPGKKLNNVWPDLARPVEKRYVVETATKTIQRAMLMTTDPGDLVLDPTCGSGTTAFVAERWGRRWITCDTSRVALAIARERLMTAYYDYYQLAHPAEGVASGFRYRSVPYVSAKTLAYDKPASETVLYDQPLEDTRKARVTGPFTMEAVPAPVVKPLDDVEPAADGAPPADASIARSGETLRQGDWRDELLKTGIRGKAGQHIHFGRLEPLPGRRFLHAVGESGKRRSARTGAPSALRNLPSPTGRTQ